MSLGVVGYQYHVVGIFKASETSQVFMTVVLRRHHGSNHTGVNRAGGKGGGVNGATRQLTTD